MLTRFTTLGIYWVAFTVPALFLVSGGRALALSLVLAFFAGILNEIRKNTAPQPPQGGTL